jgi:hypothetical protein
MHIYENLSLNSSENKKCFRQTFQKKNQNTRIIFNKVYSKIVPFMRQWEKKYGRNGKAADGNITRRMRFECRVVKVTDTQS